MASDGPTRGFFDAWSMVYDFPLVQRATYRPVHDAVLRALTAEPCARVLDLGCGTGRLAKRLTAEAAVQLVVGCDFSAGMLGHAAERLGRTPGVAADAALVRGDATSFLQRLRALAPRARVVILSDGHPTEEPIQLDALAKPFDDEALVSAVQRVID